MEARRAIEEICAMFLDAYNRGDAAALAEGYTEDCAVLAPNQLTVLGKQAVEIFFKDMIEEFGGIASSISKFDDFVGAYIGITI